MTIPAAAQGAEFEPRDVTVTPRMALAFAAAIGCTQEQYFDDARPEGLLVPPPFCVALEWMLSGDRNALAKLGISASDQLRAVHTGQDTQFRRPIIAGETVSVSGSINAIRSTRAGALVSSQLVVCGRDREDLITTSLCDAIYRGVKTDAGPVEIDSNASGRCDLSKDVKSIQIPISRSFAHVYTECASIYNPIHTERRVALAAGLPDIIVHGTALWALAWNHLSQIHGDLTRLSGRFRAMSIPGRPLTLRTGQLGNETNSIEFQLDNDQGEPVIQFGNASFATA